MVAVYGILYSTLQIDDELLRISALLRSISVISTDIVTLQERKTRTTTTTTITTKTINAKEKLKLNREERSMKISKLWQKAGRASMVRFKEHEMRCWEVIIKRTVNRRFESFEVNGSRWKKTGLKSLGDFFELLGNKE